MKIAIQSLTSVLTGFFLACGSAHGQLLPPIEFDANGASCRRGEVLVHFSAGATDAQIVEAFRQAGLNLIRYVHTPAMQARGQSGFTHFKTTLPIEQAVRLLNHLPGIDFAQPNFTYTSQADSNDPFYLAGSLWGMYGDDTPWPVGPAVTTNPFGSQAEKLWAAGLTGSRDVFVAIVDASGIQLDHPDLAANLWRNPGEIPGNGLDDDGNGYVDDVYGWNSFSENSDVYETNSAHATHIAGTIGAVGGNGIGVAGINWNVGLIAGKFGQGNGGSTADAVQAIDYMTTLRTRKGLNIVAVNASWGTSAGVSPDQALLDSVTRAAQAGILFVAAAMNYAVNIDVSPVYPACFDTTTGAGYDNVISVAALDSNGLLASFSDYGQQMVDLAAPGVTINSTKLAGTYGPMSGTSMATPHVAGSIALYASTHPAATASETRNNLLSFGVRSLGSLQGITVTGGTLDAAAFVTLPSAELPAPFEPVNLQTTVLPSGYVTLSWTDQANNELGFAIERSTDGFNYVVADTTGADLQGYTDRTVRPGTAYYYRVRACNPGGSSGYAYAAAVVNIPLITLPIAPSNLTGTALARGSGLSLSWNDRSNNELGFQLERRVNPTGKGALPGPWELVMTLEPNATRYVDSAVASLTSYSYRLRAYNLAGISAYSNEVTVKAK